ncbi:MAG: ABC transporter permease [Chitinophagales bacterium]|nr:ABC transporter permease [Chitinophagales bacterium]
MLYYLFKRLLLFIPTLIVITLLAFVISVHAPGNPVERLLTSAESGDMSASVTASMQEEKQYWAHRLGFDLPVFYLTIAPLAWPDTLFKIMDKQENAAAKSLLQQYGNWPAIENYRISVEQLCNTFRQLPGDTTLISPNGKNEMYETDRQAAFIAYSLPAASDAKVMPAKLNALEMHCKKYPDSDMRSIRLQQTRLAYETMIASSVSWRNYFPVIQFHFENQYHRWMFGDGNWLTGEGSTFSKGLIRGDLGMSYVTRMPVSEVISARIGWSLFFTLLSVLLAYLISIPVGIRAAEKPGSFYDRASSIILFVLHSMPAFWLATMLLMLFANTDAFRWFPASGVKPISGYPAGAGFFEKVKLSLPYIVLPLIAYTYSSLAFLSRLTRVSLLETLQQDYIRTARAKGLSEYHVIYKHAFRNALLPVITVFANVFPAAIGGSVILETIFTIPGMGLETYQAIQSQNYPVVIGVLTLTGLLTLTGYLVADILYAFADPRISLSKEKA